MFLTKRIHKLLIIIFVVAMVGICIFHFTNSLVILTKTGIMLSRFRDDDSFKNSTYHLQKKEVDPPHEMKPRGVSQLKLFEVTNEEQVDGYRVPHMIPIPITFENIPNKIDDDRLVKDQESDYYSIQSKLADGVQPNRRSSNIWNMSISEREKFQQAQVDSFCRHNNIRMGTNNLGRHMLIDNRTKTTFCFAPKVGCTNLKILFFLTQGAVPSTQLFKRRDDVDQKMLELAISKHSFEGLSPRKRMDILKHYYKFVMYRNPIERLFSAYRSKVQRFPLVGLEHDTPHYNWLKKEIYAYKHPVEFQEWQSTEGQYPIDINFSDFIDYWLFRGGLRHDEHFQSIYDLCQPCVVRYNYYGNFKTFDEDANVLIKRIKSKENLLRDGYYVEGEKTSNIASQYYRQLSRKQKVLITTNLALDLSFFYSIFPSERNSHKVIMDTDFEVPIFYF